VSVISWNREVSKQSSCRHKTLRGPRAGLIFFRKDDEAHKDLEKRVNDAVFPACQGGPHNNTIAGIATTLLQATQPSWKAYAQQVIKNARALADELVKNGYKLQTGGTDSHLVLWDLRPLKLTGSKVEKIGDLVGITINSTFDAPFLQFTLFADNVSQRTLCRATRPHKCLAVSGSVPQP
jgi:glycine/serine hydroxymethyltransferase